MRKRGHVRFVNIINSASLVYCGFPDGYLIHSANVQLSIKTSGVILWSFFLEESINLHETRRCDRWIALVEYSRTIKRHFVSVDTIIVISSCAYNFFSIKCSAGAEAIFVCFDAIHSASILLFPSSALSVPKLFSCVSIPSIAIPCILS